MQVISSRRYPREGSGEQNRRMVTAIVATLMTLFLGSGCGGGGGAASGGGLEARLFDTPADAVSSGPAGVFASDDADLVPIDSRSGDPAGDPIEFGATLNGRLAVGTESAWVTDVNEHAASRIDLGSGSRQVLEVPGGDPGAVAAEGNGALIVSGRTLIPYAADGTLGPTLRLPCRIYELVGSDGIVAGGCARGLLRIDPARGTAEVFDVGGEPDDVAVNAGSAWALVSGRLVRVGADGRRGRTLKAPAGAVSIAGEGHDLWVISAPKGDDAPERVTRHDSRTGRRNAGPVQLPGSTSDVAATVAAVAPFQGSLWFALSFYGGPLGIIEPAEG